MMSANMSNTMNVEKREPIGYHDYMLTISLFRPLTEMGAKTRIMELMTHDNPDVRYQALITVQRLVSQAWIR